MGWIITEIVKSSLQNTCLSQFGSLSPQNSTWQLKHIIDHLLFFLAFLSLSILKHQSYCGSKQEHLHRYLWAPPTHALWSESGLMLWPTPGGAHPCGGKTCSGAWLWVVALGVPHSPQPNCRLSGKRRLCCALCWGGGLGAGPNAFEGKKT